jgi:tRNA dimethylallyltransferase
MMVPMDDKYLVVIVGPTAIGKTNFALELALKLQTEIISVDSRQFYKELKIGTASPTPEQLKLVNHHFVGHLSVEDYYNASMFEVEANKKITGLFDNHDHVIATGGSGLYIDALCHGIDELPTVDPNLRKSLIDKYNREGIASIRQQLKHLDPGYYSMVDLKNPNRILKGIEVTIMTGKPYSSLLTRKKQSREYNIVKIALTMTREDLYNRINDRADKMIEKGLVEEARSLYPSRHLNALNTVGYKELFAYFDGDTSLAKAIELIKRNTRHYAKRQLSWFKRDTGVQWFDVNDKEALITYIYKKIEDGNSTKK